MRRNHEPRQLQAKYLYAVVKHRMPQAISRYEYLVDSVDTLHELPRCDLAILPLSQKTTTTTNVKMLTRPSKSVGYADENCTTSPPV